MSGREPPAPPLAEGPEGAPAEHESRLDAFKEFWLTSLSIHHRVSALVLFVLVTFGGVWSYLSIPKEAAPEVEVPFIAVNTVYPGVAPRDVETLITRELEEELNTIAEIKELTSTSVEGYSSITAEFETDVDLNEALQKVREKVDLAKPDLPEDAEDPSIVEFNLAEMPIMQVNISGEYDLVRLKEVAEDLQERIEQIPSVLDASLSGGLEREVQVDVDLSRLKHYGVAFGDVIDAIRNEHVNVPGGTIDVGHMKYLVRVDGEFEDPSLIEDVVIMMKGDRPIYIRDVADVTFGFEERESYARLDGNPVVTLSVSKRVGENIIATSDAVKRVIDEMSSTFPATTVVKITSDQSEDIHSMVAALENNIISGLILILAILFFFLGLRTSWFVAISIPTSMFLSFIVLKAVGITMNMVVLFSLILALGMLVDNAIVVVENIYRYREEGWSRVMAARKATGEVAMPVIAATFTTLAAFTPMLFWPDIVGDFMGYLPKTLIITLSSSLFVALVIVPVLCALFIEAEHVRRPPMTREARWTLLIGVGLAFLGLAFANPVAALVVAGTAAAVYAVHHFVMDRVGHWFQEEGLPAILERYDTSLRWSLRHRMAVVALAGVVFVGTVTTFIFHNHGVEFFPEDIPPAAVWASIEAPDGTNAEFTDAIARRVEGQMRGIGGFSDVESMVTTVGAGGGGFGGGPSGTHEGRVTVSFVDYEERGQDAFVTLRTMQEEVGDGIAGAEFQVEKPQNGPPTGPPVSVEIVGDDPDVLRALSDSALAILRSSPVYARLEGLESTMERGRPELSIRVDRERAALYGFSTAEVGRTVRAAIQGLEAAKYRTRDDEYDITVRLAKPYRDAVSALEDLTVTTDLGRQVPLSSLAEWDVQEGYGSIHRKDLDRVVTISSDVRAGENSNAVLADVRTTLGDFRSALPPGYSMRYTGQNEEQQESQDFLTGAFLLALFLMGFILVSQFNSVVKPLIILTSVIMSTVGVLVGLLVFEMPFGIIMTGVGVISLAGIVVNNAIVLIDYIDILRDRDGMSRREALVEGGITRFRPVVLTALTTALGLVPLAIGLNFDFFGYFGSLSPNVYWGGEQAAWWSPMAIAVIVGILFATVLTLILVPVLYSLVDDVVLFVRRHYTRAEGGDGSVGGPGGGDGGGRPESVPEAEEEPEPAPAPV